jgi:hypothetical protein
VTPNGEHVLCAGIQLIELVFNDHIFSCSLGCADVVLSTFEHKFLRSGPDHHCILSTDIKGEQEGEFSKYYLFLLEYEEAMTGVIIFR